MEISREAITLFGFEVRWYGILIALGVLCGVLLASRREARLGLKKDTALNLALVAVPVAIICARLYYVFFSWDYYAAHPGDIVNIRQGGLAIYGGVIGGILAGGLYCLFTHTNFVAALDLAAPSIALGQAIGRWGNFLNQEAYGTEASRFFRFFPFAVEIPGSGWHWATFFYESVWCAVIAISLVMGERRGSFRRRGDMFGWYLFLYGLERSLVEELRMDSLYLGPIRVSQLVSLVAMLAVLIVLAWRAYAWMHVDAKDAESTRRMWTMIASLFALFALYCVGLALNGGWIAELIGLLLMSRAIQIYTSEPQTTRGE